MDTEICLVAPSLPEGLKDRKRHLEEVVPYSKVPIETLLSIGVNLITTKLVIVVKEVAKSIRNCNQEGIIGVLP